MSEVIRPLTELREGEELRAVFRVLRKATPVSRSRGPFLALTLGDRTGEIEARAFEEDAPRLEAKVPAQGFVRVHAQVQAYKGRLELKLIDAEQVPDKDVDPAQFVPTTRFDVEAMFAEVRSHVLQVRNPHVRALLLSFLDDPEIGPAFKRAPAAKSVHHAFVGGLLEHTLSVLQLGLRVCDHYPELDRDLVVAGCLLHDLGKTVELRADGPFDYTEQGRLVGHLLTTTQWIHERASRIADFPRELEWHLVHLVAAHHGQLEHGSPKEPSTLEAVVVHAVDELDSRINSFELIFGRDRTPGRWTDWSRLYDRPLFRGPSWNGEPLPPDPRRFRGPGIYDKQRPAVWERPEPTLREYNYDYPRQEYAAQLPSQGPRPPQPELPAKKAR